MFLDYISLSGSRSHPKARVSIPIRLFWVPPKILPGMFDFVQVVHYVWNVLDAANTAVLFRVQFVLAGDEVVIRSSAEQRGGQPVFLSSSFMRRTNGS